MANKHTLKVKRVIKADRKTIFKALTEESLMEKWFFAGNEGWSATVNNTPEVGGNYKIDMHSPEETYSHEGEYREVIANEKLVFTWNSRAVQDTLVTITLRDAEGGTEIVLKHEFLPDEEMKKNHTAGWTEILVHFDEVISGG